MTDQRGIPPAFLQRFAEADESLLQNREREIDACMVERLYQSSWTVRYLPYPILFGAFLLFNDVTSWWSILGLTAFYTLGTWYLDRQRYALLGLDHITDPALWARRFAIGSTVTGLTWGLLGALYFPADDVQKQGIMAVAWAGIAFSNMNTRAMHLPSYYAFLLSMSVPVYGRVFVSGEFAAIAMCLLGVLMAMALSLAAHAANRRERLACALRLHNAELIGDVDRARAAAEADRRDLENAFERMQQEFAAVQRIAACGSWSWERDSGEMTWSEECGRLLGMMPGAVPVGFDAWLEQVHPDDRARVRDHHRRLRDGAARDRVAFRLAGQQASGQWLESVAEAERGGDGAARRVFGILRALPDQSTP